MHQKTYTFDAIGVVHSPHENPSKTPIQPQYAKGISATIEIIDEYIPGLQEIEGFSYIYVLYVFHRSRATQLNVLPYLGDKERGVFATRAPCRPNKIGLSIVRLVAVEKNVLHLEDIDMLDGTPVLDIKPYVKRFDDRDTIRNGWLDEISEEEAHRKGSRKNKTS